MEATCYQVVLNYLYLLSIVYYLWLLSLPLLLFLVAPNIISLPGGKGIPEEREVDRRREV